MSRGQDQGGLRGPMMCHGKQIVRGGAFKVARTAVLSSFLDMCLSRETALERFVISSRSRCRGRLTVRSNAEASSSQATPIIEAMQQYADIDKAPFHIPGHKRGGTIPAALTRLVPQDCFKYDLTELPGLDYLSDPSGPIQHSQNLAAQIFEADNTWYLVNGTTVGLQAAIMAACKPGDCALVARNCHVSVFSGLILADVHPIWLSPTQESSSQLAVCTTVDSLAAGFEQARRERKHPSAVVVVSPTYFGTCSDIKGLAKVCHSHNCPLIVDEAHGAHFGLHPDFPASAMQRGADIAVQSTHKTLTSLGQSSMLHCRGNLVSQERITQSLRLLQSTSPSYLLLASLDAAQAYAHDLQLLLPTSRITAAKERIRALPGLALLESLQADCLPLEHDPWRITCNVSGLGMSGFEVERSLQTDFDVFPELATEKVVVFALGPGTTPEHLDLLVSAFTSLCEHHVDVGGSSVSETEAAWAPTSSAQLLAPREAFFADKELVPWKGACGRVSGELLCPYPPGVPAAFPGEILTETCVRQLRKLLHDGGKVTGATDSSLDHFLVLAQ